MQFPEAFRKGCGIAAGNRTGAVILQDLRNQKAARKAAHWSYWFLLVLISLEPFPYGTICITPTLGPAGDVHVFNPASSMVTNRPKSGNVVSDLISASFRPFAFTT